MIGRVRGTLVERRLDSVTIDVQGLGYEVAVTPRTLSGLPGVGEEVVLHTHLHVREDQLALFGFDTAIDKDLFSTLIGVSGVGPKVAMAILGTLTYEQLRVAVSADDVATLTEVPGIGKRSAQKLLIELKPKLDVIEGEMAPSGPMAEVREALSGLGYAPDEIRGTLADMPEDLTVEEMLRRSLRELGRTQG
ncbi:MAG: Holliday junction branch migration protein RuvA [Acidimicrobiia bacterium]|nr:Holliday junction branch migration protein RuvA [Acidimicrobiia bacterium]